MAVGKEEFTFHPLKQETIELLCESLPFLRPRACGLKNSFGFGDRIGLATEGHIKALREYDFFPVFAQQSVRELERTGRSLKEVLNSAIVACFQEGYSKGFGADIDHLKDLSHLKAAIKAGFTFFTIDPSDAIREPSKMNDREKKSILDRNFRKYEKFYLGRAYRIEKDRFEFTQETLSNLIITYAEAIDFVETCYSLLKERTSPFDFEVSVDESSLPTTPLAHIFIVEELRRRKINFQSLALKFPGRFEKAIDYRGDLKEFEESLIIHQKIREQLSPYKISLHSGSDKFKVYPIFKNIFGEKFHVKTSGTSWVEAMKVIADSDFDFFLKILKLAIEEFEKNSASYEISASPESIKWEDVHREDIEGIFDDPNIRQIIHIGYGSLFSEVNLREKFYEILIRNRGRYGRLLERHLSRHLELLS